MITPREKAILVGAMFGGAKIMNDCGLVGIDYSSFPESLRTWINNNIGMEGSLERINFYSRLYTKFQNNQWPMDYFEKMSPLALAIWMMAATPTDYLGVLPPPHFDFGRNEIAQQHMIQTLMSKWGIQVDKALCIKNYDSMINWWLLLKQYILEIRPAMAPTNILSQHPRKHRLIYLSGGQQFSKDGGVNWRAQVSPELYRLGYDIFNPPYEGAAVADQFGVNFNDLNLEDYIRAGGLFIEKDLEAIKASDAIITFIDESALKGAGTKSEATVAVDYNIPNYFVLDKGIDPRKLPMWLAGCMRDVDHIIWNNDFQTAIHEIHGLLG